MRFYLGTHLESWLTKTDVPLFVSRNRLAHRKSMPRAIGRWALDSGGFTECSMHGGWRITAEQYAQDVERFATEIGGMDWAAPMDWMVEPWIIEKTGLSVREHQERTVQNYLDLRGLAPHLPFIPVLQGWTWREYLTCADLYKSAGVDLAALPTVGIGSVCRRQQLEGGREVIEHFAAEGVRLHAFGLKMNGLRELAYLLKSSDSLAWSYAARRGDPIEGHTHKSCNNCITYAMQWREKIIRVVSVQQPSLFG